MLFLTALFIATGASAPPEVIQPSLIGLAVQAEFIFVGTVDRVHFVGVEGSVTGEDEPPEWPLVKIARLRVETPVRGPQASAAVWVLAQGTWTCDTSNAHLGERTLWFLDQELGVPDLDGTPTVARVGWRPSSQAMRRSVLEVTGGEPLHRVSWSGRGRWPIDVVDGESWIDVELSKVEGDVPRPAAFTLMSHHGRERRDRQAVRLVEALTWIRRSLQVLPGGFPLHPDTGLVAEEVVLQDGRVLAAGWPDGSIVWSADRDRGGPPFLVGAWQPHWQFEVLRGARQKPLQLGSVPLQESRLDPFAPAGRVVGLRWKTLPTVYRVDTEAKEGDAAVSRDFHDRLLTWLCKDEGEKAPFKALRRERLPGESDRGRR